MNTQRERLKRMVAIHESAHAITHMVVGQEITKASIQTRVPWKRRRCGCRMRRKQHMYKGYVQVKGDALAHEDIMCSYAGVVAEKVFLAREARVENRRVRWEDMHFATCGSRLDRQSASARAESAGIELLQLYKLEMKTYDLVKRYYNAIIAFADVLQARKYMAKHEIDATFATVMAEKFKYSGQVNASIISNPAQ